MTDLLQQAFDALATLPEADQDRIAWEIIERVEDKTEWDRIIATPDSQAWLEAQAKAALKAYDKIQNKLTMTFVSIPQDHPPREEAYWSHFDELPDEIRALAEENYKLWKDNPNHPGLRFKRIHETRPVFSFRVGMRHRTVGIETDDGKVVWFWVGSFETFQSLVGL